MVRMRAILAPYDINAYGNEKVISMNRKSIRKVIVGLLLCLALNATYEYSNAIPVFAADTVVVNATNVNVRSQPNTKSESYGKVSKGTTLQRTEERSDGWSCVEYAGKTAYIKSDLLKPSSGSVSNNSTTKTSNSYIANKNTKKFHYPSCSSVSKMKEKNKWYFNGSRDELINKGYQPCKNCNP